MAHPVRESGPAATCDARDHLERPASARGGSAPQPPRQPRWAPCCCALDAPLPGCTEGGENGAWVLPQQRRIGFAPRRRRAFKARPFVPGPMETRQRSAAARSSGPMVLAAFSCYSGGGHVMVFRVENAHAPSFPVSCSPGPLSGGRARRARHRQRRTEPLQVRWQFSGCARFSRPTLRALRRPAPPALPRRRRVFASERRSCWKCSSRSTASTAD
jgi:hypothetical protein